VLFYVIKWLLLNSKIINDQSHCSYFNHSDPLLPIVTSFMPVSSWNHMCASSWVIRFATVRTAMWDGTAPSRSTDGAGNCTMMTEDLAEPVWLVTDKFTKWYQWIPRMGRRWQDRWKCLEFLTRQRRTQSISYVIIQDIVRTRVCDDALPASAPKSASVSSFSHKILTLSLSPVVKVAVSASWFGSPPKSNPTAFGPSLNIRVM